MTVVSHLIVALFVAAALLLLAWCGLIEFAHRSQQRREQAETRRWQRARNITGRL